MATKRFEVKLPEDRRRDLDELAREMGTSAAELERLGTIWILENRRMLLTGRPPAVERP